MMPNALCDDSMAHGLKPADRFDIGATLEHALTASGDARLPIRTIDCRPSSYQSSCSLYDIDVSFEDASTLALVAKGVDWNAMCPDAHRARLRWLSDERREPAVYESLLAASDLTTARYFGSFVSDSGVRYLLLERIDGMPLWQSGDFEAWREAARWLARLAVRVTSDTAVTSPAAAHLLRYNRAFYAMWMRRACAFHARSSPAIRALAEPYRKVVEWLLGEPQAFLHGEFYSSNVLVECAQDRHLVRPVDWETAALGPASIDLACLLAGRWSDEARADLADAYHRELAALVGVMQPRERYLRTLDYSLIHLSVRNLGWSIEWTPPPDRAHDWLGEALRLCEKWNL